MSISLVPTLEESTAPIESDPRRIAEFIVERLREAGFRCILLNVDAQKADEISQLVLLSRLHVQRHRAYLSRLTDGLAKTHYVLERATFAYTTSNCLLRKIDGVELNAQLASPAA